MQFGVQGSGQWAEGTYAPDQFAAIARAAERLGFDSLWAGDHLSFVHPILDPAVALTTFAAATRRIMLGTGVLLLALRAPGVVAKQYASLDYLSGGRLLLGVGGGGDGAKDFELAGVPVAERGARTDEAIEVLRTLWGSAPATFDGRFTRFRDAPIMPRPMQPGGPPILVGGRSAAALRRAGALGDGWLAYMVSADRFSRDIAIVRRHAERAGRDPEKAFAGIVLPISVGDNGDNAREQLREHLSRRYGRPFERHHVERYAIAGTPERVRERLAEYASAGVEHVVLNPAGSSETMIDQLEAIAEAVIEPERRVKR